MSRELMLWLLERGHQPKHLRPGHPDPLTGALEEAIFLREQGRSELSLALLAKLEESGLQSPWIVDNRARAEHSMGRTGNAATLWQSLSIDSDKTAALTAKEMLQTLQKQLLQGLHQHCSFHRWQPRHLPDLKDLPVDDLLHITLKEAISAREADHAGLSLALMEETLQQGWQSPWLHDNKARALVNLGRREEAMAIWHSLATSDDGTAARFAQEALQQQETQADLEQKQNQIHALLKEGLHEQAEDLLIRTWLHAPETDWPLQMLEQSRAQRATHQQNTALQSELVSTNLLLELHEELLSRLEETLSATL